MSYLFGQKIYTKTKLRRAKGRGTRMWIEDEIQEIEVRVIGIRTLSNGSIDHSEGYSFYEPEHFFQAALVVQNLHHKPFYIKINE